MEPWGGVQELKCWWGDNGVNGQRVRRALLRCLTRLEASHLTFASLALRSEAEGEHSVAGHDSQILSDHRDL